MPVGAKGPELRTLITRMPNTLRVGSSPGGDTEYISIQAAINYAATQAPSATNPWTVEIYPGIYDEQITCASWVNLKGIGPKGSVVIYQNDADVVIGADEVQIQNVTLRLGTLGGVRAFVTDNTVAITMRISDVIYEIVAPAAVAYYCNYMRGDGSNFIIERCSGVLGGTGGSLFVFTHTGVATIVLRDNDIKINNINANIIYAGANTTTIRGQGNTWAGTVAFVQLVNAPVLTFDNDAILCTGGWTNTGSAMILRHCAIEAPVVAGDLATVRMKNCSYRAIQRTGTGNIVDESPQLQDAPWKVHKWNWMTALANADIGVRGTPVDAGSGQVMLEVTDNAVGQEAVETNPEAAGSLGNEFTPARTPRFITQISVDSFDAHVTMFFGLRETLGDYVPAATEEHAGFIWDGTNFKASSDDGAATETTNLVTPTTDVQNQLEVIVFGGVSVEFRVNGILVITHTTRVPSATLDWQHLNETAGGGGGDLIQVTVRPGGCQECPQ